MEKLKTVGLLLALLCFVTLEVAFFAAAITVGGCLLWLVCGLLGFVDLGEFEINWWVSASLIVMLLEGVKSQIKESMSKLDEIKFIWR